MGGSGRWWRLGRGALLGALCATACADERAIELALEVGPIAGADVCLTAAEGEEVLFIERYPASEATGTLTFVAGDRVDDRLRVAAIVRRGGRPLAWAAGEAAFRAPGLSRLRLEPVRCQRTPVPAPRDLGAAPGATGLLADDLDGDGVHEVVTTGVSIAVVGGAPIDAPSGSTAATIGDVDGDCLPEVVAAGPSGVVALPSGAPLADAGEFVVLGDAGRGAGLAVADARGLQWGPAGGPFERLSTRPVRGLVIGDLDGDGSDDLLAASEAGVEAFFGGPAGPTPAAGATPTTWAGTAAALGDFDGDGALDLALVDDGRVLVARNRGDGLLEARPPHAVPGARALRTVDADHDCRDDVVVLGAEGARLLLGADDARLVLGPVIAGAVDATAADVDADGARELVLLDASGQVTTWAP